MARWVVQSFNGKSRFVAVDVGARICSQCVNGYIGSMGVFCILFDELVEDERRTALECEHWDRA